MSSRQSQASTPSGSALVARVAFTAAGVLFALNVIAPAHWAALGTLCLVVLGVGMRVEHAVRASAAACPRTPRPPVAPPGGSGATGGQ